MNATASLLFTYIPGLTLSRRENIFLIVAGSLFIAAMSQIAFPLPYTPVPITMQTLAILLLGAFYGRKLAASSVLFYIGIGSLGMPVFAKGSAGLSMLAAPTTGYLVGFIVAAYLVGWLIENGWARNYFSSFVLFSLGSVPIYLCGVTGLSFFVGWENVLAMGVLPFIPGALVKISVASLATTSLYKLR